MDFELTEKEESLKQEFYDFFEAEMKNAPAIFENGGFEAVYGSDEGYAFHKTMAKKLAERGWISMAWPKEYGGKEATIMEQLLFNEARGYFHAPGICSFAAGMFAPTLLAGASEEQKKRLLPPIAAGEAFYCQGWSEPDAGSDLASLTTTAIKDGDDYIVNGQKTWTTAGHRAEYMFLLARTDPESKRGKGLSVFHLRMDYPGVEIRPLKYMDGNHVYNETFFNEVRIPAKDLIGQEGEGWNLTRQTMNFERSNVGSFALVKRKLKKIVEYTKTTKRDGQFLADDPVVQQKLAKLKIGSELGMVYSYRIAWLQQKKDMVALVPAASQAKLFATELQQQLANFATEIMGSYGQLEEGEWAPLDGSMAELYQFCKGATIYAGTNEVQRNLIAWTALGLPRLKFK